MERKKLIKLVTAAQNGDHKAVDTLFNAYYNDVYYFALKTVKDEETACEVTQDTFVSILKNFKDLKEPAAFVTWMKQIAYNHCARFFQKKKDVLVEEDEEGNTVFDALPEERTEFVPDEALDQEDFRKTIMGMLDELSPEQRSATMLYYYSEMSVKQIAQIQGVSEGTVKSRLNYARKAIKKSVEDYEKKNDVKLHSVALLPLLFWLFAGAKEEMAAAAVPVVVGEISSATGIALTAGGMSSTATGVVAASTGGIIAKLAGIPLVVKIIAGVTAISLVVGCISVAVLKDDEKPVAVTEPICQHKWVDADCTTPKSCSLCGATEGAALGHKWLDASCEASKTCSVCGQTDGEALGHSWTDANYQAPKICGVCNTTEGEPLTPYFETNGLSVITVELGKYYEFTTCCKNDTNKKTTGTLKFREFSTYESDGDHEPADGYVWHTVTVVLSFEDENANDYGYLFRYIRENYYQKSAWDGGDSGNVSYSINFNGIEYNDCQIVVDDLGHASKFPIWEPDPSGAIGFHYSLQHSTTISWRMPRDYDGFILGFMDGSTEWEPGQYVYEIVDENALFFRFNGDMIPNPDKDPPEQGDASVTVPPVTEPPATEPPVEEPPVEEPPVNEPELTVYYVPADCTYIMADGTELQPGEAMPETCSDGDQFITANYKYKYGYEYGEGEFYDKEGNFLGVGEGFVYTGIDGWSVIVKDKSLSSYPELLAEINGAPLVSLQATFAECENMTQPPSIPNGVTNMAETFFCCYSLIAAPTIPEGVTNMHTTLAECSVLATAPTIPSSVTMMWGTFAYCSALTGNIQINAVLSNGYGNWFSGTVHPIVLTGCCDRLEELAATAENGNVTVQ